MLAVLTDPFAPAFMRRALAGCVALSLAAPPLGVVLVLRRMSLMSDPLQHGILPGIAVGAALAGGSLLGMAAGGLAAGLAVALLAGWLARATDGREDSQLAATYLVALALGVCIVSLGGGMDLGHLLFGSVLAVDDPALMLMAGAASVAIPGLALIWRPLILDSFDPDAQPGGTRWYLAFLALTVLCVVAGFAALGTMMAVGLMMLPAIAARHWSHAIGGQVRAAVAIALLASAGGLWAAYHLDVPAGPAIVLAAGAAWLGSVLAGPHASLLGRLGRAAA
jgi:zinc/manganese transport system permease protein